MAQIKRSGEIRLGDARMCILENPGHVDDAYERGFKREVFRRIIQTLNRLGWLVVIPQDKIERYSASFARQFRYCTKGDLKADLKLCGRCIELEFFQNVNAPDRPDNEGRYQYDKEKHMPYLLRMEMLRTRNRIVTYLSNVFDGYERSALTGRASRLRRSDCFITSAPIYARLPPADYVTVKRCTLIYRRSRPPWHAAKRPGNANPENTVNTLHLI